MTKSVIEGHGYYQVGLKVLLRRGDEFLFLKSPLGDCFDFPGGRIMKTESETPFKEILKREISEELGPNLKYRLKEPVLQFRRFFKHLNLRVFITVYEAEYLSGPIHLSNEHSTYHWINPLEYSFEKKDFLTLEEYNAFNAYFRTCKASVLLS